MHACMPRAGIRSSWCSADVCLPTAQQQAQCQHRYSRPVRLRDALPHALTHAPQDQLRRRGHVDHLGGQHVFVRRSCDVDHGPVSGVASSMPQSHASPLPDIRLSDGGWRLTLRASRGSRSHQRQPATRARLGRLDERRQCMRLRHHWCYSVLCARGGMQPFHQPALALPRRSAAACRPRPWSLLPSAA